MCVYQYAIILEKCVLSYNLDKYMNFPFNYDKYMFSCDLAKHMNYMWTMTVNKIPTTRIHIFVVMDST